MEMTEYQRMEQAKLDDIGHDTDALIGMLGENKMGESFDSGLLAGMLQKQGVDPGMLALLKDDNGFGNGNGMWILVLFLLILGRGNGFFGGNAEDVAKNSTLVNEANYTRLMDAISTQGTRQEVAIGDLATSVGCNFGDVKAALAGVDKSLALAQGDIKSAIQSCCCNIRTEVQASQNAIQSQMAKCCCDTNLNIERQGSQTRADIQDVRYLIQASQAAQDNLIQSQFASQNAYLADQFCQIKGREDQREIQALRDKLTEQREAANTLSILNAIANRDTVSVSGSLNTTAGTWTGTGSVS